MKVVCAGAGPAGLYAAVALKRRDPGHDVVVLERHPPGVTHGWGVVFWDDLLDDLHRVDPPSARAIRAGAVVWEGQAVRVGHRPPVFLGGSGYAIGRHRLLALLADRAKELGADLRYSTDAGDPALLAGADLVVAADGAGSRLRTARADVLGTEVHAGRHRYVWLGTPALFDTFTFAFVDTGVGWIWCHAYRFDHETSTFIVECPPATWTALGLDRADPGTCLRTLERLFAHVLHGAPLRAGSDEGQAPWLAFRRVTNRRWHADGVVLAGDAAHTTHFAIGSGTALALRDAAALAARVDGADDLPAALTAYGRERRAAIRPLQEEAARSTAWFEDAVTSLGDTDDLRLGWSLWQRRRRAPAWRWYLHVASQHRPVRRLRVRAGAVRRALRARRRELATAPPPRRVPETSAPGGGRS
ncbi:FAD-dependent monooxygenase [Actinomycetospora sp. CA-101289]|uniref:FAD-dependent monooxygenase n=1 Tax=Actinomycetospora sp. CA-101289 TaxID=3239893 RepID=UPI003D989E5B